MTAAGSPTAPSSPSTRSPRPGWPVHRRRRRSVGPAPRRVRDRPQADGRPLVSHAWARTIDGVQGGTWDQVHLLATPALDRYRGYVGQSRSIAPTHTWNTTPQSLDDAGDHGGRLVRAALHPGRADRRRPGPSPAQNLRRRR